MKKNGITIAIFPFANLSEGQNNHLFCQALLIDLVTELCRFRQFEIITYESAQAAGSYNDNYNDGAFQADYLIKGTFRCADERLVVNAQLVSPKNSHLIWADRFEGNTDSLFSLQEELLREIVSGLQQQLNYDVLKQLRKKPPIELKTYEYWLHGMEELKKGSLEADVRAREYFQLAIETDPSYSLAYSGMSLTYFNEWSCQLWDRWEVSKNGSLQWASKAIELDDQNNVAAVVLGRNKLYNGEYEIAEHYLRRALTLNPNDTECLVQIASCFVFLGNINEAEELYQKVLRLKPLEEVRYYCFGTLIFFESGAFKKAVDLSEKVISPSWVDYYALVAAAYFHLGKYDKMVEAWHKYLTDFSNKIGGGVSNEQKALKWMKDVNPYRDKTNLKPFWKFIENNNISSIPAPLQQDWSEINHSYFFQKQDQLWLCTYNGVSVRIGGSKGFDDIAKLISSPHTVIHCSDLIGSFISYKKEQLFDEKAKKNYRKKIVELKEELCEAESNNDPVRAAKLHREYDSLLDYLSRSIGLQGKTRQTNNPTEKARTAVTWRIRKAIQKIEQLHPSLGKHLSLSVKTGTFCSYKPEREIQWQL